MKVIDKLVDIANNGVSETIQYFSYYNRNDKQFENCMLILDNLIYKLNNGALDINDEIEIIEYKTKEDKKIEKLYLSDWVEITSSEDCKPENLEKLFNKNACNFSNKINEIIDYLNSKGDK